MHRRLYCLALIITLGVPLGAQQARVRIVEEVSMPAATTDSNSPAYWHDGQFYWFGSHGYPALHRGPDQFGPWEEVPVNVVTTEAWTRWVEAVWQEENGTLWAWYHTEPMDLFPGSTLTVPRIGALVSYDGGQTLFDLGIILETGDVPDPTAQNGYFAAGHGDFSVIFNEEEKMFYFFFGNYGGPAENQGVCVARMAYEDRFAPVGKLSKYHNGSWQEPGLGGAVTPIFRVRRPWQLPDPDAFWGPSLHWNTHLQSYVMLLNHAQGEPGWSQEGVYISYTQDISRPDTWSAPVKLVDKAEFSGWYYFYPQVMGLGPGETDTIAGETARLYINGSSRWEIDFIPGPPGGDLLQELPAQERVPTLNETEQPRDIR